MKYATLAYVPVVHQGTLNFFRTYPGPIYLLDNTKATKEYVYFERDLRALAAEDIKTELQALGFLEVTVIAPDAVSSLASLTVPIVSPQDEAVQFFVGKYAPSLELEYVPAFLRWTKIISTQEFVVPPHRTLTHDAFAREVIRTLTDEAQKSADWWRQIGGAIVKEGKVLFSDYNRHLPSEHVLAINGDPRSNLDAGQRPDIATSIHAEAALIAHAAKEGVALKGADIYTTTFPCPVCARLIRESGIARVFYDKGYSTLDAEEILTTAHVEIVKVEN